MWPAQTLFLRAVAVGVTLSVALGASGCLHQAADQRADQLAAEIRSQELEHFVSVFALSLPQRSIALAQERAHAPTVRQLIQRGDLDFEDDADLRELVTLLYAEREYEPVFVYGTRLTPDGQAVASALREADTHALDETWLHVPSLEHHLGILESAGDLSEQLDHLSLTEMQQETLLTWVESRAAADGTFPADDGVFAAITHAGEDNPLASYARDVETVTASMERAAESAPTLELLMASGYLRYATTLRFSNLHYVTEEQELENGWDVEDEAHWAAITRELAAMSFRRGASTLGFGAETAALPPPFEQYRRLRAGLIEYQGFMAAGGWDVIDSTREWREGQDSDVVPQIRRRLSIEGYFDGTLDEREFDTALEAALEHYQRTHQLDDTGTMTDQTYLSMNRTVERRVAEIELAMQEWRTTRRANDLEDDYIWVNVPDFHAELWDGAEMVYRWRTVVGREFWRRTPRGREIAGRTELFSDEMLYLVFNPYWNVPETIRREEYDERIEADPNWLADNNFELVGDPGGRTHLRQLPGSGNALGRVKFIFPNEHDIYMHDTPSRGLFRRPTRSYSHGCIRVEDPIELAELLLARDRDWEPNRARRFVRQQLELPTEQWVSLLSALPVHIEYYTVRGDEDGYMHFLADPYTYFNDRVLAREAELRGEELAQAVIEQ